MSSKHREPQAAGEDKPRDEARIEDTAPAQPAADMQAPPASGSAEAKAGAEAPADATAKLASLQAELAAVREELSEVNDKYLRKLADDVNFRKRMAREKEEGQRYAVAALLADLVPVLDDFDRAIASAEASKEYAVLHDGIQLIRRQMGQMLENKYGLARFTTLGQPFDPNRHEAVATVQAGPGEEGDEAVVAEEYLPGYGLHDRILRTAKVRVRMPSPKAPATPETGAAAAGEGGGA